MKNFLSISTGTNGSAVVAERVVPISGETPAQSRVRLNLGGLVQAYSALTMTQKGGWQSVANTFNSRQNRVGRSKMTPANVFVTLNSALLACNFTINSNAPADLNAPPVLPDISIDAHNVSGAFSMQLLSSAYANAVCLWAAPPAPVGKNTFPDNSFKLIGSLDSLTSGTGNDIADLYAAAFGTPEAGSQIALKLVAISAAGIRLSPLTLIGTVSATAADGTVPAPASPLRVS